MGMFRCDTCERFLDSKDGEYNMRGGREYCDDCLEATISEEVSDGEHDQEYSEYIMEHTPIGNGTMLINAIESGAHFDGFIDHLVSKNGEEDDSSNSR